MDFQREVTDAYRRIEHSIRRTPVEASPFLSAATGCRAHLKLENLQSTGSFKLRGAMNKLLATAECSRGVVAASTGNHGLAVARGASQLGCPALIFAPETAQSAKLDAIRSMGGEVRVEGEDCVVAEAAARAHAAAEHLVYVSPYNDPLVVAGQGTLGLELHEQLDSIDALFVAVGGGGLASGVGGFLKAVGRDVEVVGCSPENSAVLQASLEAGRILDLESKPTLSDGTAGGVEADAITFGLASEVIDRFVLVSEDEIRAALRAVVTHHHTLIEGAAAVAVAALQKAAPRYAGKDVAVVLCGANIDPRVLKEVL